MKIITHPATFHADEVLTIALLAHVSGKSIAELNIKRTRDTNILKDVFVLFTHTSGSLTVAKSKADALRLAEMIVAHNQDK